MMGPCWLEDDVQSCEQGKCKTDAKLGRLDITGFFWKIDALAGPAESDFPIKRQARECRFPGARRTSVSPIKAGKKGAFTAFS
jgi:hypothetical protein